MTQNNPEQFQEALWNSGGASSHAPPPLAAREPTRRRWKGWKSVA